MMRTVLDMYSINRPHHVDNPGERRYDISFYIVEKI